MEIPEFAKPMKSKVVQRQFNKDSSVFKSWRLDTAGTLAQAFKDDIKAFKGARFIKSDSDREQTVAILKANYLKLKEVFLFLAACGTSWPNIGMIDFGEKFASKAKIIDNICKSVDIDRNFISANLKVENSFGPEKALSRYEFLEVLVRLANFKYLETKTVGSFAEATDKLITDSLKHFHYEPWQQWREEHLWTMDVNDIFEANIAPLKTIFNYYKSPSKPNVTIDDCIVMCTQRSNLEVSEKDIAFCYGYSHQTVINEERQSARYKNLEWVEFLEFIARVAHSRFKSASEEVASQPLHQKIEFILDDLLQGHGLQRQEVNIEVEEFSESDDDY